MHEKSIENESRSIDYQLLRRTNAGASTCPVETSEKLWPVNWRIKQQVSLLFMEFLCWINIESDNNLSPEVKGLSMSNIFSVSYLINLMCTRSQHVGRDISVQLYFAFNVIYIYIYIYNSVCVCVCVCKGWAFNVIETVSSSDVARICN